MWFKVDDGITFHAKTIAAGNEAMGVWVRAGAWCGKNETDGLIPDEVVALIAGPKRYDALVERLVTPTTNREAGLWVPEGSGFRFHEWSKFNPLHEQLNRRRAGTAGRVAKHRAGEGATSA